MYVYIDVLEGWGRGELTVTKLVSNTDTFEGNPEEQSYSFRVPLCIPAPLRTSYMPSPRLQEAHP